MTTPTKKKPGRPRDDSRDGVIVDAVIDVLAHGGMAAMTMDTVANVAGVGKATIYRRWSTSGELLCAALAACRPPVTWPGPTGDLVADVTAVLRSQTTGRLTIAPLALLSAMPFDDELRGAWFDGPGCAQADAIVDLCHRARARGVVDTIGWAIPIRAAIESLRIQHLLYGRQPDDEVRSAVRVVVGQLDPHGAVS